METVAEVIERMRQIERSLDPRDGVACFNRVYLQVTELVAQRLTEDFFDDDAFVEQLDVIFAGLYFQNVDAAQAGNRTNRSWRPLFAAREDRTIWPFQFVLAGMNAHINHDLALAVISTCAERDTTPWTPPVHADYLRVNELLDQVESQVRRSLEPHLVKIATRHAETLKHLVGSFSVSRARDMAWASVETLWPQRGTPFFDHSVAILAQTASVVGRLLLTPVIPPPDQ